MPKFTRVEAFHEFRSMFDEVNGELQVELLVEPTEESVGALFDTLADPTKLACMNQLRKIIRTPIGQTLPDAPDCDPGN